ncbi:MAG: diadenosine tetraphosphate hydrolase [Candidatus Doudnabacteria bacterium RIFCSPLOWO2_02_FULL_49_13]|uniref:Diadenosine tetraphosphate hydrolase n=1 Tax=Candidatus Doudnabacteria bacterium RIFCSPHIGHO2_12_FULL_48_16 TaxID=1817838 RepID=A0A1F5PL06_9BACT|nr:MAG: diadenosine tetraphosphate hydrolase [Candidatus Doudnabacteria bacterium RIFCSPHIGHO2_02_FULL_49_24]OGE89167.1 MAG: diadenosine tetraphosphate hydrolase [Candidatus Doudnabacteria bacterium RIFCSPHIGHO2_01_FULL_50_67]OGE90537.1 MAG: diadenosine tetraphosphate hydrolase [Candidatus Doudnabacteria bacterium RIFCSPHIGHO2_12_FULL_48_16]OGE97193.1 MAG: diadenosine tetraphosphate hydrolase [Candidatus Doudnabacteria bacterium RIFCSPLOWO2_01_FULL_49_40]OGF02929.1 MAG: diadenosine tetraphospha
MKDCLFCSIIAGTVPSHKVWEDAKHLAFLTIFPNTEGVTVVVTKDHHNADFYAVDESVFADISIAARKVGQLLIDRLDDVGRTGIVFEGFGINHLHVKLFPMHGTKLDSWQPIHSDVDKYFEKYEGYISSHDYKRDDDEKLAKLAAKIRGE